MKWLSPSTTFIVEPPKRVTFAACAGRVTLSACTRVGDSAETRRTESLKHPDSERGREE